MAAATWFNYGSGRFLSGPGALIDVAPDDTHTTITTELVNPTGVAAELDGAIYIAQKPRVPGRGEVGRIVP